MRIGEHYHINAVVVEVKTDCMAGDIYDDFDKFRKDHPKSPYCFGFAVIDDRTGYVADGCNDWNASVDDAVYDYKENCR